jgi:hypothetical protein
MNNCTPSEVTPAIDDPCALLPQLRAALYQLMAGQARSQVRNGEQWLTWHQGNVKELRAEVRRLELLCSANANAGRAIRVGPYVPFNAPHRRNRY